SDLDRATLLQVLEDGDRLLGRLPLYEVGDKTRFARREALVLRGRFDLHQPPLAGAPPRAGAPPPPAAGAAPAPAAGAAPAGAAAPGAPAGATPATSSAAAPRPCALNLRVGANSPRRWPTMFSVMNTGM